MQISYEDLLTQHTEKVKTKPVEKTKSYESTVSKLEEGSILQPLIETELERQLADITDPDRVKEKRRKKQVDARVAQSNIWSKRIKSKAYRKVKREEKQRKLTENMKIQIELEDEDEMPFERPTKSENPDVISLINQHIKKNQENLCEINSLPTENQQEKKSTENTALQRTTTPKDAPSAIESILEVDQFVTEKIKIEQSDAPEVREETLLGWNSWGGASLETKKNPSNTKKITRTGITIRKRKDFATSHLIINESLSSTTRNKKYSAQINPKEADDTIIPAINQPATLLDRLISREKEKRTLL
ncbi:hypothetical protein NERG_00469 [Nematocida ausubeli]|uniref:Uncharacterized protein n=1 Tax=Nematocida ausubeli (strain ATCC PRA-371 / ERTm2) TaxID=1913371 RepID=H8ZA48_NEMA1|nr:hypothetical protein NERG_00469 [Nematocida ausubeli]